MFGRCVGFGLDVSFFSRLMKHTLSFVRNYFNDFLGLCLSCVRQKSKHFGYFNIKTGYLFIYLCVIIATRDIPHIGSSLSLQNKQDSLYMMA